MKLPLYQIDAFTNRVFSGNPAAVMPLDTWLDDATLASAWVLFNQLGWPGDAGIDEDPVTGSIHSVLVPYWAKRLGRNRLEARQVSERGGVLRCELKGDGVSIAGQAAFYLKGTVHLPGA